MILRFTRAFAEYLEVLEKEDPSRMREILTQVQAIIFRSLPDHPSAHEVSALQEMKLLIKTVTREL